MASCSQNTDSASLFLMSQVQCFFQVILFLVHFLYYINRLAFICIETIQIANHRIRGVSQRKGYIAPSVGCNKKVSLFVVLSKKVVIGCFPITKDENM